MSKTVRWDVILCSLSGIYGHFREPHFLYLCFAQDILYTLKEETVFFCKGSVNFSPKAFHHIPADSILYIRGA
jgi:hypothetical protein